MASNLLEIKNLNISSQLDKNTSINLVENLDLKIRKGQIVGLVGESGCGKSITALSISQLNESPPLKYQSGSILYHDNDLLKFSKKQINNLRGKDIGMIFQEPMTSLNPSYTIGMQLNEVLLIHEKNLNKNEKYNKCIKALENVGITEPTKRYNQYPHELSGGIRQRVMIAMAMICNPELLIADEPTTALDVTIQAQILKLITSLQKKNNMSVLLITHDLAVVSEVCEYVYVMYAGKIIEHGTANQIFSKPKHPYTNGLLNSIPHIGENPNRLPTIPGRVLDPSDRKKGCYFYDRCSFKTDQCYLESPKLKDLELGHEVRCWNPN